MGLKTDILKVADALVGWPIAVLLSPFAGRRAAATSPAPSVAPPPRRVLIIRPGGIGDAVLFLPMLRELRRAWPQAQLDLLVEKRNAGVVRGLGLADHVLLYDRIPGDLPRVLAGGYDLVIDTEQYHRASAIVALLTRAPRRIGFGTNVRRLLLTDALPYDQSIYEARSFLELARCATGLEPHWDPEQPFLPLDEEAVRFAEAALAPLGDRPRVAIHPGASIPERRWPPERYAEVAAKLAAQGIGVAVLGGREDVKAATVIATRLEGQPAVILAGKSTLAQAAAIVAQVDVYVSADTGVLHLAYAVGTRTVHLFGPGVLSKWGPPGHRFRSIAADAPCSPCTVYGYTPPCNQGNVCMLRIEPERVVREVLEQLAVAGRS
ncbi:MAG: glycosyltransferase family 9 protein [Acidobacteria bacterium]|nr:glycosyltransferase family 9 protein [Acidobacteriota bacterium]